MLPLPAVADPARDPAYYVGGSTAPPPDVRLEYRMSIEKAFAIRAAPHEIYAAIERDLHAAHEHAGDTFAVLRRDPSRSIELRVTIGGMPCWLTYTLEPKPDHTEVVARLVPFGWKYTLFRIMTFGMRDQGYEIALVEALANLKSEVEDPDPTSHGDDEDQDGAGDSQSMSESPPTSCG
jgi:hypothetical protein